jgi:hypothetical protein
MTPINYRYFVRGKWAAPVEKSLATVGESFLRTLDSLSGIDPLFAGWQLIRNWKIAEDEGPRYVPLAIARERIVKIVENGLATDDLGEPAPEYGYWVAALAGARGPHHVRFRVWTHDQSFVLAFGEYNIASDLTIVTYPLFKAALLAISAAWDTQWACAQAFRNDVVKVPIGLAPGAMRIDSATPVPIDPTFPYSPFHIPWIAYLSAERAAGLKLTPEIQTECTPNGGLLMTTTTERLDPTKPEHARRARVLVEILIACAGDK